MSDSTEQRKLAAIMFTDMVGYSALSQRNEALALELLEEHRGVLRGFFPKHQGTARRDFRTRRARKPMWQGQRRKRR